MHICTMGLGAVSKYVVGYLTYITVHWRNSHDNESHMFVESANFAFLVLYVLYGVEYIPDLLYLLLHNLSQISNVKLNLKL